ncbi:thiamine ABC transporter substrate binding subunit [Sulfurospirillum sp.]|nr:thiamine ABC transporter substrate binding subunit [Sulfurospirillum sp.]
MNNLLKYCFYILFLTTMLQAESNKPTLVIYAYDSFTASWGPAPKVKEAFEKECNCNLEFVSTSSAIGSLRKIQLEGSNTKADILLGLDKSSAGIARKTGLFIKHNVDTSKLDLPIKWNDKEFLPYDYGYFAFVYNSNKTKKIPNSFEELQNMPEDFKIIIQDPRSSTPGLGLMLWIKKIYGKEASAYWQKLSPHILTVTKGWSEAYGLFLKGEADMVLSYTTSPAYHIIAENKTNFKTVNFKEGHYGQIEVLAILKSSKHKKLAKKFLEFTMSETFANIIPTTNWSYPVIKTKEGLPKGFESLHVPSKMLLIDDEKIEKNRKKYQNEWLDAIK